MTAPSEQLWKEVLKDWDASEPVPDELLYSVYENGGYDGSGYVVYRRGDDYYFVHGSHCSCFGLEGQWEPEKYTLAELYAVMSNHYHMKQQGGFMAELEARINNRPRPTRGSKRRAVQ